MISHPLRYRAVQPALQTWRCLLFLTGVLFALSTTALSQDRATGAMPLPRRVFAGLDKAAPIPGAPVGERKVSMRELFPTPRDQGSQQSCTAFAAVYAVKGYLENREHGWAPNSDEHLFSPAYIYNPLAGGQNVGIYIQRALTRMETEGACTWDKMPWSESDITTQPSSEATEQGRNHENGTFRIERWDPITVRNINDVKNRLAAMRPVIIAAYVDVSDNGTWDVNANGVTGKYRNRQKLGYHAMVVVGYDDDKDGPDKGAFEVMNSWGDDWNDNGYAWISYDWWEDWASEGYVVQDKVNALGSPLVSAPPPGFPVGDQGLKNGNRGFPKDVSLEGLKLSPGKKLPAAIKSHVRKVFSAD